MVSRPIALWLTAALVLLGCSSTTPRTELIIVADTNIDNLDAIRFEVSAENENRNESAETTMPNAGPATLGLVQQGASAGPLTIVAKALRQGRTVVERSAKVSFVARQTRVVELHLLQSCVNVSCSVAGETCTEQGCRPQALGADDLSAWRGDPPLLTTSADAGEVDASSTDGGTDAGNAEAGANDAAASSDAAPLVDCGGNATAVNLQSNVDHCGMCKNACKTSLRNAVPTCTAGDCGWECRPSYEDCDGMEMNGCEQSLLTNMHCGGCGEPCMAPTQCRFGSCR